MSNQRHLCRIFGTIVVSAGLAVTAACSSSSSTGPINVPLAYKSTGSAGPTIMTRAKVYVAPVIDGRTAMMAMGTDTPTTMPAQVVIGHNVQGASPVPVYDTGATPMMFLHDALVDQLGRSGVTVVTSPDQADRIVTASLTGFDVTEAGTYKSTITAMVGVTDKTGVSLYGRSDTGEDSHWGSSRTADDYQQNLNAAATNLVQSFLNDAAFQKALTTMQ